MRHNVWKLRYLRLREVELGMGLLKLLQSLHFLHFVRRGFAHLLDGNLELKLYFDQVGTDLLLIIELQVILSNPS